MLLRRIFNAYLNWLWPQYLFRFWFLFLLHVIVLEYCNWFCSCRRSNRSYRSSWIISRNIFSFITVTFSGFFFLWFFFRCIWITRITRYISKLSSIPIWINITIFTTDYTVSTTSFFFKTSISGLITKRKRTIIIDFIIVSYSLYGWCFWLFFSFCWCDLSFLWWSRLWCVILLNVSWGRRLTVESIVLICCWN